MALFGLHYILFVFLPVEVNSSVFKIWTFAELALSSTQVGGEPHLYTKKNLLLWLINSLARRASWWPCSTASSTERYGAQRR